MSNFCPVAVSVSAMNLEEQPKTIGGSLLGLLKSKKFCNVIFTFPNLPDRIEAHKFCLKARSPVFEQIFRMRKSGNVQGSEIEISDCSPERFQQFLEFIYADQLEVDIPGALDLLQLARKYKVHPLTVQCEEVLQTEIPIIDSVKVFECARHYGMQELMDRAGQTMVKSFVNLMKTSSLMNADEETLVYLLERDDLDVKEVQLFQVILEWGRSQVGTSADEELLRSKLKNMISKIRYTNMDPKEFTNVVVPTGLLSAEEKLSVYEFFCGDEITRRDLKIMFNTSRRKGETRAVVSKYLDFDYDLLILGQIEYDLEKLKQDAENYKENSHVNQEFRNIYAATQELQHELDRFELQGTDEAKALKRQCILLANRICNNILMSKLHREHYSCCTKCLPIV